MIQSDPIAFSRLGQVFFLSCFCGCLPPLVRCHEPPADAERAAFWRSQSRSYPQKHTGAMLMATLGPMRRAPTCVGGPQALQHRPSARTPAPAAAFARRLLRCQAAQGDNEEGSSSSSSGDSPQASEQPAAPARGNPLEEPRGKKKKKRRQADSSDWVTSALTRRFGIAGGLAWAGFLTFGVVSEQIKTRIEVGSEAANTRDVAGAQVVETPEGLKYQDLKTGGGSAPQRGFLVLLDFRAAVVPADAGPGALHDGEKKAGAALLLFISIELSLPIALGPRDATSERPPSRGPAHPYRCGCV